MWLKPTCFHGCLLTNLLKRVGSKHCASLHAALLQQAEYLPAAGNWIHASWLDLDKNVPPSPKHFTGVWWVLMNGAGGATQRRGILYYRQMLSSSLQLLSTPTYSCQLSLPSLSCYIIPFPWSICCPALKFSCPSSSLQAQQLQFPHWLYDCFPSFSSQFLVTSHRSPSSKS